MVVIGLPGTSLIKRSLRKGGETERKKTSLGEVDVYELW